MAEKVRKYRRLNLEWTPEQRREYGRTYCAEYYAANRERLKARARERYQATKDIHAARYRENREAIAAKQRLRRDHHVTGEALRAAVRRRYAENPGPAIDRANRRRARLMLAGVRTDRNAYAEFVRMVRSAESIACRWCGQAVRRCDRTIDHIIPISRGGTDDVSNLCCACRLCNARKADKLPIEWLSEI